MGSPDAFTWSVFAFAAVSFGALLFLLNYLRDPLFSPAWLAIWLFDQLAVLLAFFIIKFLVLDRVPVGPNRTWLNLVVVVVLGAVRAVFASWMQTLGSAHFG